MSHPRFVTINEKSEKMTDQEPSVGRFVELHAVDDDGATGTPTVLLVQEPAVASSPILVIVRGRFAHAAARTQAVGIARRQADEALRVAIFEIEEESAPREDAQLDELHAAFHAVIVVTRAQHEQVVRGLVRTILTLDVQDQSISCDWHDVSHIVRTAGAAAVACGCGRGRGAERAALATREAIMQAGREGSGLRAARGICVGIRGSSRAIYGREIKEVIHQVRARINPAATITMSIGCDSALPDGVLDVDIFAFGELEEAQFTTLGAGVDNTALGAARNPQVAWQGADASLDPLYAVARAVVVQHQRASISLVQRHLHIGYTRAAQLLDAMEGDLIHLTAAET